MRVSRPRSRSRSRSRSQSALDWFKLVKSYRGSVKFNSNRGYTLPYLNIFFIELSSSLWWNLMPLNSSQLFIASTSDPNLNNSCVCLKTAPGSSIGQNYKLTELGFFTMSVIIGTNDCAKLWHRRWFKAFAYALSWQPWKGGHVFFAKDPRGIQLYINA